MTQLMFLDAGRCSDLLNSTGFFNQDAGIDSKNDQEAIEHQKDLARHFRDDSLRDHQDLEITVINALGRQIHREYLHRQ
jgi:hypothetical protein